MIINNSGEIKILILSGTALLLDSKVEKCCNIQLQAALPLGTTGNVKPIT